MPEWEVTMTTRNRNLGPFPGAAYAVLASCALALGLAGAGVGATTRQAPGTAELAAATYRGIEEEPVTLIDGHWEGEPALEGGASVPRVDLAPGFRVTGDLDSDGGDEAVALLSYNFGGSGVFSYLAVVGHGAGGGVENLATTEIGDRVQLRSATIEGGVLTIETVESGPGDGACCPGQMRRRTFALADSELSEQSNEDLGRLSLAALEGVTWRLVRWMSDEPVADDIEIDLVADENRIAGGSGCNRYTGSVADGELPGDFTVGTPLAVTRMACPSPFEEAERRYLKALQSATRFRFVAGRLAVDWSDEDEWGSLVFASTGDMAGSQPPASPSFDCEKAESSAEKLVCETPELARLDRELADVWEQAIARWPEEEIRRQHATQRGWIKGQDECWKADDLGECVAYVYRTRILELRIQSGQLEAPTPVAYRCAGEEGKPFTVSFYSQTDPSGAVVTFGDDQVILFGVRAASGARYVAPGVEFWEHHGEARVDFFGQQLECAVVDSGS
jgi:uncharacterized protein/heat shock protein HslJ